MNASRKSPPRRPADLWRAGPVLSASDGALGRYVARPIREFLRVESASGPAAPGRGRRVGVGELPVVGVVRRILARAREPRDRVVPPRGQPPALGQRRLMASSSSSSAWRSSASWRAASSATRDRRTADRRRPRRHGRARAALSSRSRAAGTPGLVGASRWRRTSRSRSVCWRLLGRGIPSSARLFLLALAIVDDIGAIMVIAVFYTADLDLWWLVGAIGGLLVVVVMRLLRIWLSRRTSSSGSSSGTRSSSPGCTPPWRASRSAC